MAVLPQFVEGSTEAIQSTPKTRILVSLVTAISLPLFSELYLNSIQIPILVDVF